MFAPSVNEVRLRSTASASHTQGTESDSERVEKVGDSAENDCLDARPRSTSNRPL